MRKLQKKIITELKRLEMNAKSSIPECKTGDGEWFNRGCATAYRHAAEEVEYQFFCYFSDLLVALEAEEDQIEKEGQ